MAAVRGDIRTTPSSLPAFSKESTLSRQAASPEPPGKAPAACSVKPLAFKRRFQVEGDASRRQDARAGRPLDRACRRSGATSLRPVPGPAVTLAKPSSVAALAVASPTAKSGSRKRRSEIGVRGKRAERIAARDDQRLRAVKVEGHVLCRLDEKQRREHGLMAARGERLGLARCVRFRPGDEEAHQSRGLRLVRKFGPASASSSRPASVPMLAASSARAAPLDLVPLAAVGIEHEAAKAQGAVRRSRRDRRSACGRSRRVRPRKARSQATAVAVASSFSACKQRRASWHRRRGRQRRWRPAPPPAASPPSTGSR